MQVLPKDKRSYISVGILIVLLITSFLYYLESRKPKYRPKITNISVDSMPAHITKRVVKSVVFPPKLREFDFVIRHKDDLGKTGRMHSRMISFAFKQETATRGISADVLKVGFDRPAEIVGVWISIDSVNDATIFELAGTINSKYGYENTTPQLNDIINTRDAVIHVSLNGRGDGKLDEHIFFGDGKGFEFSPEDRLVFGAWIHNISSFMEVWPEIIIYYRWL